MNEQEVMPVPMNDINKLFTIYETVIKYFIENGQGIIVQLEDGKRYLLSRHAEQMYISSKEPDSEIPVGRIVDVEIEITDP